MALRIEQTRGMFRDTIRLSLDGHALGKRHCRRHDTSTLLREMIIALATVVPYPTTVDLLFECLPADDVEAMRAMPELANVIGEWNTRPC